MLRRALLLSLAALAAAACRDPAPSGKALAERHCQGCHLLPEPALLDSATWDRWVLPRMGRRLGLPGLGWPADAEPAEGGAGGALVRAAGVFPDSARLSRAEWDRLARYYVEGAPRALAAAPAPPATVGLPGFRPHVAALRLASPMVTLVRVDPAGRRVWVGDGSPAGATLAALDARGRPLGTLPVPSPVSHLAVRGDTLSLLFMGRLHPSDVPRGALALVPAWRPGAEPLAPRIAWAVDTLQRPVFASWGDLSGDGVDDAVVSEFGNLTGRLAWYERLPGGGSRRHVLAAQPGALGTHVRDFDGDGRLDVLALLAQGDESVALFRGRGGGELARETLLRFPPSYGSTSLELADLNGDGHADLVYTSGDAGDYPSPPKPYHGVRLFLGDGRGKFAESYFHPLPGAFRALARDFDGDGDVDVAAIAFYPDYASGAPRPFVYLENTGGMRFLARTVAEADLGRWLTMDAGDVDGDGDEDLVLGSFAQPDQTSEALAAGARWRRPDAPAVLILENLARAPRP